MWCRTIRKRIYDYVDGLVDGRMAGKMQAHIDHCVKCAAAEEDARHLTRSLAAWEDVPVPEDGLHRLETRLAFVPQMPASPRPKGKLYTLVLPYMAGAASAAAIMLALLPMLRPERPETPAPTASPVAFDQAAAPELLPGEKELTYRDMQAVVDEDGNLIELPPSWRRELQRRASERMRQPNPGGVGGAIPVEFEER